LAALLKPAASFIGAMFCSNQALRYVSYPVQALAKSCKMVPVIAFQTLWFKKVYALRDYVMVALVTLGIIVFQDGKQGGENTAFGLLLLFASLCLDGITGPYQENVQKEHGANGHQVMLWCNLWAFVFLAVSICGARAHTRRFTRQRQSHSFSRTAPALLEGSVCLSFT
jgi:UDP-galactose transporter B1